MGHALFKRVNLLIFRRFIFIAALLAVGGCGGNGSQEASALKLPQLASGDKPVAIAPAAVYTPLKYMYLEAGQSYDLQGRSLSFRWNLLSGPPEFPGLAYADAQGKIGFSASWTGTYRFELRVNNGVQDSDPVLVEVHACCGPNDSVDTASAFLTQLPSYSIDQAKYYFAKLKDSSLPVLLEFARTYGFSMFQLDFLRNLAPGTTVREIILADEQYPAGGATIEGYGMTFSDMVQVPADFSKIAWPSDYSAAKAQTVQLKDPYCNDADDKITFAKTDLGQYALPAIAPRALPASTMRIVGLKDVWSVWAPNYVVGCVKDMKVAFNNTLNRVIALGGNTIILNPWTFLDGSKDKWRVFNPSELNTSTMNDAALTWAVGQAKKRGLKVIWINQIQGASKGNGAFWLSSDATPEQVLKSYDALDEFMLDRGALLQKLGVDAVMLGSWLWADFSSVLDQATFAKRTENLLRKLRQNFKGKVIYEASDVTLTHPALTGLIDMYSYNPQAHYPDSEMQQFSLQDLKSRYRSSFEKMRNHLIGKQVIWGLGAPSRRDIYTTGYMEETFCSGGYGLDAGPYSSKCLQLTKQADFSMQALIHEASFEFLSEQTGIQHSGVSVEYWMDNNLLHSTTFPNLAASVRGKPSEYIAYKWFTAR